ncbi:hypothetical protein SUGI_0332720 [Cryptomeria japonica]|nr:hypothetical protein SUGI_0332720 [Cryptomeria japonica]
MDCWDKEETELGLKLCCSPVKRKGRYSCSVDLFNESSCKTVSVISESLSTIAESLGMPYIWPTPEEQRLMEMYRASSMEEVTEITKSNFFHPR